MGEYFIYLVDPDVTFLLPLPLLISTKRKEKIYTARSEEDEVAHENVAH